VEHQKNRIGGVDIVLACASKKIHEILCSAGVIVEAEYTECGEIFLSVGPGKSKGKRLTICVTELEIIRSQREGLPPDQIAEKIVERMLARADRVNEDA